MQLGTLLNNLQNEGSAADALEALDDIVLFTRVTEAASRYDETAGEYIAGSVGRFAASASDETWLGLVSAIERADDPGKAALVKILDWAIQEDDVDARTVTSSECTCGDTTRHGRI